MNTILKKTRHNYEFWEALMRTLNIRIIYFPGEDFSYKSNDLRTWEVIRMSSRWRR